MSVTTETREYDKDGRLTKVVVVKQEDAPVVRPWPAGSCNCGKIWHSILPPPPCPVHSAPAGSVYDWRTSPYRTTTTTNTPVITGVLS